MQLPRHRQRPWLAQTGAAHTCVHPVRDGAPARATHDRLRHSPLLQVPGNFLASWRRSGCGRILSAVAGPGCSILVEGRPSLGEGVQAQPPFVRVCILEEAGTDSEILHSVPKAAGKANRDAPSAMLPHREGTVQQLRNGGHRSTQFDSASTSGGRSERDDENGAELR